MEAQIMKASGVILSDTNNRILAHKSEGYVYGVMVNTICRDMKNDTSIVRDAILRELKDFSINIKSDLLKYVKINEESYDASIRMRDTIKRVAVKIFKEYDKSERAFTDLKVRCTIDSFKHVLELKKYAELHNLHN